MKAGQGTPSFACKFQENHKPSSVGSATVWHKYGDGVAGQTRGIGGGFCEKSCNSFHQGGVGNRSPRRDHRYPMKLQGLRDECQWKGNCTSQGNVGAYTWRQPYECLFRGT